MTFYADRYDVEVALVVRNLAEDSGRRPSHGSRGGRAAQQHRQKRTTIQPPTLWVDGKRVQEDLAKLSGERVVEGKLSWVALQDTYFTAALLPKDKDLRAFVAKAADDQASSGCSAPNKRFRHPASGL